MVHTVELFLDAQVGRVRIAYIMDPRSFVHPVRLYNESSVVCPLAGRVAKPPRFCNRFRKIPSIGPDGAEYLVVLIRYYHFLRHLNDHGPPEFLQLDTRKSRRITELKRIVHFSIWR